ncbi:MAG: T9SS type A sorting domain-containing protein [Cyclobacteriaceae bacterium]
MGYYFYSTRIIEILVITVLMGTAYGTSAQSYDLRFVEQSNDGSNLTMKLQLSFSATAALGSSNLVFSYNGLKVASPTLTAAHNFDQSVDADYAVMTLTGPASNTVSINIELLTDDAGTSLSADVWTDVADIEFSILDNTGSTDFQWELSGTQQTVAYLDDNATFLSSDALESENVVLPVELTSFTATYVAPNVRLKWATASELNNDYFEVQRSADGGLWTTLGRTSGAGTTNEPQVYRYIDQEAYSGGWYYRLLQVDYDGATEFSNLVWVPSQTVDQPAVELYPNPTMSRVTVRIPGASTIRQMTYRLVAPSGSIMAQGHLRSDLGAGLVADIDMYGLSDGIYVLRLESNGVGNSHTLIKR